MKVEIVCTSLESVHAAITGGADRIELCEHLEVGGVTPAYDFINQAVSLSPIPIHILIRPRGGDFVFTENEISQMEKDIEYCLRIQSAGVVIGCLTSSGKIDLKNTQRLVRAAGKMAVTFHRAFDMAIHDPNVLEDVIATGCSRLLTSGQAANAIQGSAGIRQLIQQSNGRIIILPGGGVRENNVEELIRITGATEVHSSCLHSQKSDNSFSQTATSLSQIPLVDDIRRLKNRADRIEQLMRTKND
ncbi:MAG TPA: copper homeostasis protein CutC [Bacteroidia bacterium]|nr:copper homeostasis protein CutC [Bacteroidia bacterium]HNP97626.1 copper homeostasis protein CutC [Bacteroidia bacterium]